MIIDLDELIEEIRMNIHIMGKSKEHINCKEYVDKSILKYLQILLCLQAYRAKIEQPQEYEWKPNKYIVIGHIPPEFLQYDIKIPKENKRKIKPSNNLPEGYIRLLDKIFQTKKD